MRAGGRNAHSSPVHPAFRGCCIVNNRYPLYFAVPRVRQVHPQGTLLEEKTTHALSSQSLQCVGTGTPANTTDTDASVPKVDDVASMETQSIPPQSQESLASAYVVSSANVAEAKVSWNRWNLRKVPPRLAIYRAGGPRPLGEQHDIPPLLCCIVSTPLLSLIASKCNMVLEVKVLPGKQPTEIYDTCQAAGSLMLTTELFERLQFSPKIAGICSRAPLRCQDRTVSRLSPIAGPRYCCWRCIICGDQYRKHGVSCSCPSGELDEEMLHSWGVRLAHTGPSCGLA